MATNYFTVDKILKELLHKTGEDTLHNYNRLLPYAYDFLDQFKANGAGEIRTISLDLSSTRTVRLPDDFIRYSKVGVMVGDKVRVLSYNSELSNLPACEAATVGIYQPYTPADHSVPFLNYGRELIGFGRGGYDECFSLDKSARLLRFGTAVNVGKVYLEYISSEINLTCDTPVNPMAKKAMESYVLWQYYLHRKDPMFRVYDDYYNRRDYPQLIGKMYPFSAADLEYIQESNYSLLP